MGAGRSGARTRLAEGMPQQGGNADAAALEAEDFRRIQRSGIATPMLEGKVLSEQEVRRFTQRIVVRNRGPEPLRFILEPWAEEFELPPGEAFTVEGASDTPGEFEVEVGEGVVVVYGWSGCIARVFHEGREITPTNGPPPDVPAGQSAAAFLRRVLGGKL